MTPLILALFLAPASAEPLDLDEALLAASRHNPSLAVAEVELDKAQAQLNQARGLVLPMAQAGAQWTHMDHEDTVDFSAMMGSVFEDMGFPMEIDRLTGESLRWFGESSGSWSFEPEDSSFYWQHGVTYTDEGNLLLSTSDVEGGEETLVREYHLDHDTSVLEQVWSFGQGEGLYSASHSDARRLPGGNTLHNLGQTARLREITPDGTVVWDMSWGDSHVLGVATPLEDLYEFMP